MERLDLYRILRNSLTVRTHKSEQNIAERKEKQRELFWGSKCNVYSPSSAKKSSLKKPNDLKEKKKTRAQMLVEWKAQKIKRLEEEKKKRKPIFKVGIVHKKATGSPLLITNDKPPSVKKVKQVNVEKREGMMTRLRTNKMNNVTEQKEPKSTQKKNNGVIISNKFSKVNSGVMKPIKTHQFKVPESVAQLPASSLLTIPYSPKIRKSLKYANKDNEDSSQKKPLKVTPNEGKRKKPYADKVSEDSSQKKPLKVTPNEGKRKKPYADKVSEDSSQKKPLKVTPNEGKRKKPYADKVNEDSSQKKPLKATPNEGKRKKSYNKVEVRKEKVVTPVKVTPEKDDFTPIYHSPFVTVRNKKGGRTPKKSLSMNVDEHIEKENKVFACRILSFRKYLECETKRLLDTCEKWKSIYKEFQEVPDNIDGDIDSVVGKTKLLTSDKFKQFQDLIDKCESGNPLIKIDDLQGFQDWVAIEVEGIDKEFYRLEKLKCNNWQEENKKLEEKKVQNTKVAKNVTKKPVARSNIRAHIEAVRKMLKEGKSISSPSKKLSNLQKGNPVNVTPKRKDSLLIEVLTSETKKRAGSISSPGTPRRLSSRRNSGLEILVASQKNKLLTLDSPPVKPEIVSTVVVSETPTKSILKKKPKKGGSSAKAKVTFDQENRIVYKKGLDEKYFRPILDEEDSPMRLVLKNIKNHTPSPRGTYNTRSRANSANYS